jgi:hypothetical protein
LKTALVEAAHAAARTKGSYSRDKFYRLKARRGYKRAGWPTSTKSWWQPITCFPGQFPAHELGDLYLDKLNQNHLTRNLVHRLERLGYTVTFEQKAA